MPTITVDGGVRLAFRTHGAGTPLLLLHAFPLGGALWDEVVARRAALGNVQLIVPDLRGFGASDAPAEDSPMERHAADMVALLDHLDVQQAVVVGVSLGGYITFAMLRHHAARVRAAVLANTRAGADSDEGKAARETNAQLVEREGVAALTATMLPRLVAPDAPAALRERLAAIATANTPQGIAGALRGMARRPDATAELATLGVPVLVVGGTSDQLTPLDEAYTMYHAIPRAQLATIARAGHLACIEQPNAFTAALADFLVTLPPLAH